MSSAKIYIKKVRNKLRQNYQSRLHTQLSSKSTHVSAGAYVRESSCMHVEMPASPALRIKAGTDVRNTNQNSHKHRKNNNKKKKHFPPSFSFLCERDNVTVIRGRNAPQYHCLWERCISGAPARLKAVVKRFFNFFFTFSCNPQLKSELRNHVVATC